MNYTEFLKSKVVVAESCGFEVKASAINKKCKPHQKDIVRWAVNGGRRAVFASFGLGKTVMALETAHIISKKVPKPFLIGLPLGVRLEFIDDAKMLGYNIQYVKDNDEMLSLYNKDNRIFMSNYERIREGKFNAEDLSGFWGDEFSVIRSLDTITTNYLFENFSKVPYRFLGTATPSPNEYTEILNYAHFLGIMDRGQALTRFFQRDSQKAGNLTLYPHKEQEFWLWVSSWAVFITKPSDLGYPDTGYDLPEMQVIPHCIHVKERSISIDRQSGNVQMFRDAAGSLSEASKEKRESQSQRIDYALNILNKDKKSHYIIWHHLESEREEIQQKLPEAKSVYGKLDMEIREEILMGFRKGKYKYLSTKPEIAGQGGNYQYFCNKAVFVGISYKFEEFIQAIHRLYRFLQKNKVEVHIIYTDAEQKIYKALMAKWSRHNKMVAEMRNIIKKYGLNNAKITADLHRTLGVERTEVKTDFFHCIHNDNVLEMQNFKDNSIDMHLTSIPFGDQYEYCESYHDMGHNAGDVEFFKHMDYLTPELLRTLKPGRIAAIHVKDRIQYSYQNGVGFTSLKDFAGITREHFEKHGFYLMGKITITTDVVTENNQTYRLTWTEQCKDGTKMGCGLPEYILLFRKPPTDMSNGYADEPVIKSKDEYTLGRWQIDAHSYWRSNGNRLLDLAQLGKLWKKFNKETVYDYEFHIELTNKLRDSGKLPTRYMAVPPHSNNPYVWDDVSRMKTLNTDQTNKKKEKHICPLQFDIVDRLITRFTNEGEIVFDPFGGLMTVPYRCIPLKRYGVATELNKQYYLDGLSYCKAAEAKRDVPNLFDLIANIK